MKNYVIIGGTKGIGNAVAQQLIAEGNRVYIYARNVSEYENSSECIYHSFDAINENDTLTGLPDIIDGLVYCPGSINLKPFHRLTSEDFLTDFYIHILGAVKCIQACLAGLKNSKSPGIVLYSSVAAKMGMPFHASIATAKGGVEGLTKSLAAEFAPKIRVNAVAPSLTATGLSERFLSTPEKVEASNKRHPLNRVGTADDIASMTCFLLSEKSSWMTGQLIAVDGGMLSVKV